MQFKFGVNLLIRREAIGQNVILWDDQYDPDQDSDHIID